MFWQGMLQIPETDFAIIAQNIEFDTDFIKVSVSSVGSFVSRRGAEYIDSIQEESQHLSGPMFGAVHRARELGKSVTDYDELLGELDAQVEEFFGMGA
jgi:hypothetical protein